MLRRLLSSVALLAAMAVVPAAALACSCALRSEPTRYRAAGAGLVGRLVKVRLLPGQPEGLGSKTADFRFRVLHAYKRRLGRYVTVRAGTGAGACGLTLRRGRTYALYLDRYRGHWTSGLCDMTTAAKLKAAARKRGRSARLSAGRSASPRCGAR